MLLINTRWILLNNAPPLNDDNNHLLDLLFHYKTMLQSWKNFVIIAILGRGEVIYPPVLHNVGSLFFYIFGETEFAARISMFPFLVLMSLSTYGYGKRLWGVWPGLAAAICATSSCWIQEYSRCYFFDLPLTACVIFHLYAMSLSEHLTCRKGSMLWGISLGLGLMTKWTFLLWVLLPEIYFLGVWLIADKYLCFKKLLVLLFYLSTSISFFLWRTEYPISRILPDKQLTLFFITLAIFLLVGSFGLLISVKNDKRLFPGVAGIVIASFIVMPWYAENSGNILFGFNMAYNVNQNLNKIQEFYRNWGCLDDSVYYLPRLMLLAFLAACRSKKTFFNLVKNYVAALSGFVFMTLLFVPHGRYVLPSIPPLCVLSFSWLSVFRKFQWIVFVLLMPIFIWQAVAWMPEFSNIRMSIEERLYSWNMPKTSAEPDPNDYGVLKMLQELASSPDCSHIKYRDPAVWDMSSFTHTYPLIWCMSSYDRYFIQARVLEFYCRFYKLPLDTFQNEVDELLGNDRRNYNDLVELSTYFVAIWKYDTELAEWTDALSKIGWDKELVKQIDIEDGSHITVYRRTNKRKLRL